jgi:hypothetical protein
MDGAPINFKGQSGEPKTDSLFSQWMFCWFTTVCGRCRL